MAQLLEPFAPGNFEVTLLISKIWRYLGDCTLADDRARDAMELSKQIPEEFLLALEHAMRIKLDQKRYSKAIDLVNEVVSQGD